MQDRCLSKLEIFRLNLWIIQGIQSPLVIVDLLIVDSLVIVDRLNRPIVYSSMYFSRNSGFSRYSGQFAADGRIHYYERRLYLNHEILTFVNNFSRCWTDVIAPRTDNLLTLDLIFEAVPYSSANILLTRLIWSPENIGNHNRNLNICTLWNRAPSTNISAPVYDFVIKFDDNTCQYSIYRRAGIVEQFHNEVDEIPRSLIQ